MASVDQVGFEFDGSLLEPGTEEYEQARMGRVFHSRHPDRFPAAILQPTSERDLVEGVRLARDKGWQIGIRSGGHSFPVWGVRDGALLIDLGNFKEIEYHDDTHVVSVTTSVTGTQLNAYLTERGRFFAAGNCPSVGIGGFLLQGGMGINVRGWGWAAEQLVAIDVITADGELLHANERENPDLFWAARGAGPGYPGLIVRYHLNTRPNPGSVTSLSQVFAIESYEEVLGWLRDNHTSVPDNVHLLSSALVPPFEVPGLAAGEPVITIWAVAFGDTREETIASLEPLLSSPLVEKALMNSGPVQTNLTEVWAFAETKHPAGKRYQVDSAWVQGETEDIVAACRRLVMDRPRNVPGHTFFMFILPHEGPDMAMSLQTDLMIGCYMIYDDPADDERYRDWMVDTMADVNPYAIGQYWGDSDQRLREVKCLTDEAWERLQVIKAQRDPEGVFVDYLALDTGFRNVNEWEPAARVGV